MRDRGNSAGLSCSQPVRLPEGGGEWRTSGGFTPAQRRRALHRAIFIFGGLRQAGPQGTANRHTGNSNRGRAPGTAYSGGGSRSPADHADGKGTAVAGSGLGADPKRKAACGRPEGKTPEVIAASTKPEIQGFQFTTAGKRNPGPVTAKRKGTGSGNPGSHLHKNTI